MLKKLKNRKGFTLIEIIVVIVILAVLMAVAVPSVMSYINEGNNAKYETVARAVLVNTQTGYAKCMAYNDDQGTDASTLKYGDGENDTLKYYVETEKKYTGTDSVELTDMSLTDSTGGADADVKAIVAKITIDSDVKYAKVETNKKVTISDSEITL